MAYFIGNCIGDYTIRNLGCYVKRLCPLEVKKQEPSRNINMKVVVMRIIMSCVMALYAFVTSTSAQVSQSTKKLSLAQCVNEFDPTRVESTKVGFQYWFVGKDFLDGRTIKMSVVPPRQATHAPHRHSEDEFFFVLEGTAEFNLDGETCVAGANTSFYCPPNRDHGIRNIGEFPLKYLVIKKYELK